MRYLPPLPGSGDAGQQLLHQDDENFAEGLFNFPNYLFDKEIRKINDSVTHLNNQLRLLEALVQFAYSNCTDMPNGSQLTAITMPDHSKKIDTKDNVETYSQDKSNSRPRSKASTSSSFDSETNSNSKNDVPD